MGILIFGTQTVKEKTPRYRPDAKKHLDVHLDLSTICPSADGPTRPHSPAIKKPMLGWRFGYICTPIPSLNSASV